jgi:hypothetical protein
MAALDPFEPAQPFEDFPDAPPRATLRIVRHAEGSDYESDDDDDDDSIGAIERRLAMELEEEDSDESDSETKGGPSDPAKVKKARLEAVAKQLVNGADEDDDDMEEGLTNGANGTSPSKKAKGKALAAADFEDDDEDSEDMDLEEEVVVCTLDTAQVLCQLWHHRSKRLTRTAALPATPRPYDHGPGYYLAAGRWNSLHSSHWQLFGANGSCGRRGRGRRG